MNLYHQPIVLEFPLASSTFPFLHSFHFLLFEEFYYCHVVKAMIANLKLFGTFSQPVYAYYYDQVLIELKFDIVPKLEVYNCL